MRASSPSIEHGSRHWTVIGAPSLAELDAAVDLGRRSRHAAHRRVRRHEPRRSSLVPVTGMHHRLPETAGKPSGSGEKQAARFLKRTCSSHLSELVGPFCQV